MKASISSATAVVGAAMMTVGTPARKDRRDDEDDDAVDDNEKPKANFPSMRLKKRATTRKYRVMAAMVLGESRSVGGVTFAHATLRVRYVVLTVRSN